MCKLSKFSSSCHLFTITGKMKGCICLLSHASLLSAGILPTVMIIICIQVDLAFLKLVKKVFLYAG